MTEGLNAKQRQAIETARTVDLGYVWGPPGTGKTTSLGALIREVVDSGGRVLVLSPYNVAVDQAMRAAHRRGTWSPGQIVRFGRVSDEIRDLGIDLESLLERHAEANGLLHAARRLHASVMLSFRIDDRPAPATVRRCLEELGELVVRLGNSGKGPEGRKGILSAIQKVRRAFRKPEPEILAGASVVGTTVAMSLISPLVYGRPYDHVIVDEASVVRTPEALLVALMSGARITFFGDPKQLPAIVRCKTPETQRWLRPSPFQMAGIERPVDAHGSCVMLTEQHRMAPPIRAVVSEFFYDGQLEDGEHSPKDGRVLLLDTSETLAQATTRWIRMSPSKENLAHRGIVGSLLETLSRADRRRSILVLSPFRAQKIAYEREATTNRFDNVPFATVHSSQGSESDVVILDLVLAPGRGKSRFMDEELTPEFRNLLNVSISRAQRQLVLVAHCEQISRHFPDGLLDRLTRQVADRFGRVTVPSNLRIREFVQ